MIHRTRTRAAAVLAAAGLLLASLGGVGLATASAGPSGHAAKKHHVKKKKPTVKKKGCIPQTSHDTDNDPDNHGGPNDGDGCV